MKPTALLALGAVSYLAAAWMVAPGFYDGFLPPEPYNFTCPPPQAGANGPPSSGHLDIKVTAGATDANSAFTNDSQVVIGFLPNAFAAGGATTISVDITPLGSCPHPAGITFVTNVYHISSSAPLVKAANLDMEYSNLELDPSAIYFAASPDGPWRSIGAAQQRQPYVINNSVSQLGYFAGGYASATAPSTAAPVGGGQTLPIVVAALIALVVLGGIPLAILRRRQSPSGTQDDDEDE